MFHVKMISELKGRQNEPSSFLRLQLTLLPEPIEREGYSLTLLPEPIEREGYS